MSKQIRKPYVSWIFVVLSAILFVLVLIRALRVSITHDEAYTYIHYVKQNWLGIILYKPPHIPNNHILNTLLIKVSTGIFGLSPWALRLPNILFSILFFWYAGALAKKFRFPGIQILAFLALVLQVYFFDYFALARGYGMALSLSLASIYHFYCYRELDNGHHIWRTLIFAAFAVYANFTFLYSYLAIAGLLVLLYYTNPNQKKKVGTLWRPVFIVTIILAAFITLPLRNISGDLFGGTTSFWANTWQTLSWSMRYGQFGDQSEIINISFAILLLIGGFFFIKDKMGRAIEKWYFYSDLLLWLVLTAVIQIVQHYILGTEYLTSRTALVYTPLFFTSLLFIFQRFNNSPQGETIQLALKGVLVLALALNFKALNFERTFEWPYDQSNTAVLNDLKGKEKVLNQSDFKLGINWLFEPALNFYREADELTWMAPVSRNGYQKELYDGYYLWNRKDQAWIEKLEQDSDFEKINEYPNGAVLYLRKDYL